ncbi:MAG: hypothetical protein M5T61_03730 [Acidimicrobiia bacterium]|nr:hypothetical protein [Acidimicrobiia bacterium]
MALRYSRFGMVDSVPRATRRVSIDELADLLADPPRASVAFLAHDEVHLIPVRVCRKGDGFLLGFRAEALTPRTGTVATLLVDAGVFTPELRGVRLRGVVDGLADGGPDEELTWCLLVADQVVAWDYSKLRRSGR